jgi:hypothetical protein
MRDEQVLDQIDKLVAEEHELYRRAEQGGLDAEGHARMQALSVGLDQCWDLLRRRRALRDAGEDPDAARVRSEHTVEHYEQ